MKTLPVFLLVSYAAAASEGRIDVGQAKELVLASLTAHELSYPKVEALPDEGASSSRYIFITVTWEGLPEGGSVILGNYAVDALTGDVFSLIKECNEEKRAKLRSLQAKLRKQMHLSQTEYLKIKTKGPLCED